MSDWLEPLGPLASPFGVCSMLVLLLILERLLFFASLGRLMVHRLLLLQTAARTGQWTTLIDQCRARRGLPAAGLRLLLEHRSQPRGLREEILGRWLGEQRRRLHAPARWLLLLAVVGPLLGLLGTALGMIGAFRDLGTHAGPVYPVVLADSLRQTLPIMAVSLIVVVPALAVGYGFRIWADAYLAVLENLLNQVHRAIDGVAGVPAERVGHPGNPLVRITFARRQGQRTER